MLFSSTSSLLAALTRASHLAYCDDIVRYSRYEMLIPEDSQKWALRMFDMWRPSYRFNDDNGAVAHWMRTKFPELYDDLAKLADKIERNQRINSVDWDLIINGVEKYRRHLINTADHCDCF